MRLCQTEVNNAVFDCTRPPKECSSVARPVALFGQETPNPGFTYLKSLCHPTIADITKPPPAPAPLRHTLLCASLVIRGTIVSCCLFRFLSVCLFYVSNFLMGRDFSIFLDLNTHCANVPITDVECVDTNTFIRSDAVAPITFRSHARLSRFLLQIPSDYPGSQPISKHYPTCGHPFPRRGTGVIQQSVSGLSVTKPGTVGEAISVESGKLSPALLLLAAAATAAHAHQRRHDSHCVASGEMGCGERPAITHLPPSNCVRAECQHCQNGARTWWWRPSLAPPPQPLSLPPVQLLIK
ncbi:hypothetical protein J6590_022554 [Homalodisca vitripennis]|nr:hypothetical protein J6590_022554 [Homalodisca vitripennis]